MLQYQSISYPHNKRVSSGRTDFSAIITVEATFTLPLFLFFCFILLFLFEIRTVRTGMYAAMAQTVKKEAGNPIYKHTHVVNIPSMNAEMIVSAGENTGGFGLLDSAKKSADFSGSYIDSDGGILTAKLHYRIPVHIPLATNRSLSFSETMQVRLWFGDHMGAPEETDDPIVYITEHGTVYHSSRSCTHLKLSIRPISSTSIGGLRNGSGGKYHPCEICARDIMPSHVFITDLGSKLHYRIDCSGLKRSVTAIRRSRVGFRRPCSKCYSLP